MKLGCCCLLTVLIISSCRNESKNRLFRRDTSGTSWPRPVSNELKAEELARQLRQELKSVLIDSVKYYVVEGDLLMDDKELSEYCLKRFNQQFPSKDSMRIILYEPTLTIGVLPSGQDAVWNVGDTIRYSISKSSFEDNVSNYNNVVNFMKQATSDWNNVCNIKFLYVPKSDKVGKDDKPPAAVNFFVTQDDVGGAFIAESFFPGDPISLRKIRLDPSFYNSPYDMTGMLRHELGHILGFRHEHIWSRNRMCPGESTIYRNLGARQETEYDPYSVMHYLCGDSAGDSRLLLTHFDSVGAAKAYPFPN